MSRVNEGVKLGGEVELEGAVIHTVTVSSSGSPTMSEMVRWTCTSSPAMMILHCPVLIAEKGMPLDKINSEHISKMCPLTPCLGWDFPGHMHQQHLGSTPPYEVAPGFLTRLK